jgi:hypothetical protein
MGTIGCFVPTDWHGIKKVSLVCCATSMTEKARPDFQPEGSPTNWRCIAVEKLSKVKLLEDTWRTAPNHSRPASCVIDADIDAEDHPERDPQKGH